ncbi:Peptidase family U32 [uncultured archaeon]|nr:Peptidase family U32 [uncultured archaeon]
MGQVELLSPAGNWDALKAAVYNGADAVYFGAGRFNARRRAENFSVEDLPKVVGFCHENGVRSYLAANTLVKNGELKEYFDLVSAAYLAGVDAVIIQEVSFIPLIRKHFPHLLVHVSTQAGVFNSYFKEVLEGADLVVLPREFTLSQVRDFREKTGIPVEVFVQGALCFSVGGQCLMSSFLGGRSGNRGWCAQPCRKLYNGKYALSTKDLCLIRDLPALVSAGVSSLKIEGRLRSPEYVGATTALYRRALDSISYGNFSVDEDAFSDVALEFNRDFTKGLMFKDSDVVNPVAAGKRGVRLGTLGRGGLIRIEAQIKVGDGVGVVSGENIHGDLIRKIEQKGVLVEGAEKNQQVRLFLNAKEGDEIYLTSGANRRKTQALKKKTPITANRQKPSEVILPAGGGKFSDIKLLVKTHSLEDADEAIAAGADVAYYSIFAKDFPRADSPVSPYVPRCLTEWNAKNALDLIDAINPASVLCGDLGVAVHIQNREVYGDISINAFNDLDVGFLNERGITPVISPELSLSELAGLSDKRFAVYAHGRLPLMTTKYLLNEEKLADEKGYVFPVRGELDYKQVLNSVPIGLYGEILKLKEAGIVRYLLDLENDISETVHAYRQIISGEKVKKHPGTYTLGHLKKGVE